MLSQRIRNHYYKTLGTRVINIALSHISLISNANNLIKNIFLISDRFSEGEVENWAEETWQVFPRVGEPKQFRRL